MVKLAKLDRCHTHTSTYLVKRDSSFSCILAALWIIYVYKPGSRPLAPSRGLHSFVLSTLYQFTKGIDKHPTVSSGGNTSINILRAIVVMV